MSNEFMPLSEVHSVLATHYRLAGALVSLSGERDRNFLLRLDDGTKMVVKIAGKDETIAEIECQMAALDYLAASTLANMLPTPVRTNDGALMVASDFGVIRTMRYLEGVPLASISPGPATSRAIGARLAELANAMRGFDHPGARRALLWDVMQWQPVARLADQIADSQVRRNVRILIDRFAASAEPVLDTLRWQILHNDFNPHNLICADDGSISGIIDFGDMTFTTRVADLAVALSYHFSREGDPLGPVATVLTSYVALAPLEEPEIALLVPAIGMRVAATLAITEWRARQFPERASYLRRNVPSAEAALTALLAIGQNLMTDRIVALARQENARCSA